MDVLRWLRENVCPWHENPCSSAARGGHLRALRWLRENGFPWNAGACSEAALGGHLLSVLQWARANGCPWDRLTTYFAANEGHVEVFRWALESGCECDEQALCGAAELGHLEIRRVAAFLWGQMSGAMQLPSLGSLIFFRGCERVVDPWDELTCAGAAGAGRLDMLQWALSHGCPWDESTCTAAAANGNPEVLHWALENGCIPSLNRAVEESSAASVVSSLTLQGYLPSSEEDFGSD